MKRLVKDNLIFFIAAVIALSALLKVSAYTSLRLNETSLTLKVSQTFNLTAAIDDDPDKFVFLWRSDNEAVAKVDKYGTVTAVSPGTANISVSVFEDPDINDGPDIILLGETDDTETVCRVTVEGVKTEGISLDRDSLNLRYKGTASLTAKLVPEDADAGIIKWSSSDPKVAEVDGGGRITATGRGTALITAESPDGEHKAVCRVTVRYTLWQWLIIIFLGGFIWY